MQSNRQRHELEELETRLMFSADPVMVMAETGGQGSGGEPLAAVVETFTPDAAEAQPGAATGGQDLFDDAPSLEEQPAYQEVEAEAEASPDPILATEFELPQTESGLLYTQATEGTSPAEQSVETLNAGQGPPIAETMSPTLLMGPEISNAIVAPVERPMLVIPGVAGTFAAPGAEEIWYTERGIAPEFLKVDPLAGFYNDIVATFENAAGYTLGDNLFEAAYDWRMAPGPSPDDETYDGIVEGLSVESLTDDTYAYGVDYLGYWMELAVSRWEELYGSAPDGVDLIVHSTGGLVARTYLQSDAYGASNGTVTLPEVQNLIMVAVPNRGAPKAWNPLYNNFSSDPAFQIVLSKVMVKAYEIYLKGETIHGGDYDITLPLVGDPLTPEQFIQQYVPTVQALLATFEFLIPEGGGAPGTANGTDFANKWILDLNDGLDVDYTIDEYRNGEPNAAGRDPNKFYEFVRGKTVIVYSDGTLEYPDGYTGKAAELLETITTVQKFTGPDSLDDFVTNFDEFYGHNPAVDEIWYMDQAETHAGDGTVPTDSSLYQFRDDPQALARYDFIKVTVPNLMANGDANGESISHTGVMLNFQMQRDLLELLEIPYIEAKISTDRANSYDELLLAVISLQILDPQELLAHIDWNEFTAFGLNQALRVGLSKVSDWAGELSTIAVDDLQQSGLLIDSPNPLQVPLPFTSHTLSRLLDFQTLFDFFIAQPLIEHLENNPDSGTEALLVKLQDWAADTFEINLNDGAKATFQFISEGLRVGVLTLSDPRLQELLQLDPADTGKINEMLMYLPFEYTRTSDAPLDLGAYAELLGFEIDASATIEYAASLSGTLVIGIDMRPGVPTNQRFFLRLTDFEASAEANTSDLAAGLNVGILGTDITNGSVTAAAGLRFGFDPAVKNARGNITQRQLELNPGVFDGFLALNPAFEPFATLDATLPISVSFAGLGGVLNPVLSVSSGNLFEGRPLIDVGGFGDLINFTSISTGSLENILESLISLFNKIQNIPEMVADMPFAEDLPISTILNIASILDATFVNNLRTEEGELVYSNLQEFIALADASMNPVIPVSNGQSEFLVRAQPKDALSSGGTYDGVENQLNFSFTYGFGFSAEEQALSFDYDLTPVEVFVDGGKFTLSGDGTLSFDLLVGMESPVASLTAQDALPVDGILSSEVVLEILLNGGVLSSGQSVFLSILPDPENATPADLVGDINTAIAASQLAGLIQARLETGHLVIETTFQGPNPSLYIRGGQLLGYASTELDAHLPSANAQVSDLSADFNAHLVAEPFSAGARIGYVGVFINEGSADLGLDFSINFTPDGPKNIRDLFLALPNDPVALLPEVGITGSGYIQLGGIVVDGGFVAAPGSGAAIRISLAAGVSFPLDEVTPAQFEVELIGDFSDILKFESLDFATMIQLLRDGLTIVEELTQGDFLDQELPFIGGSVNDLLTTAEDFARFIDEMENSAPATIQNFAALLEDSIQEILDEKFPGEGLVAAASVVFGNDNVLTIDFSFIASTGIERKFSLDPLGAIPGLGRILDVTGESMLEATLAAWIHFVLGIDLSNPSAPVPQLLEGTEAAFEVFLSAEAINFAAAAPLSIFIRNGYAHIDDGTPQRGPARASFAFDPLGTDRLALGSVSYDDFAFSLVGRAEASLPVRIPFDTPEDQLPTPITFSVNFNDLGNPTFNGPDFEEIFASLNLFDSLADGLDLLFFALKEVADGEIFGFEIPFIGDQLAEVATFILELKAEIRAVFDSAETFTEQALEDLLFNAIGPEGIGFLLSSGGNGLPSGPEAVSPDDVRVDLTENGGQVDNVEVEMRLGQFVELLDLAIGFKDGLPGLNLNFNTDLIIELAWEWRLVFGVNRTTGFYLETRAGEELKMSIEATLPDTALGGSLGFLGFQAQTRLGGQASGLFLEAGIELGGANEQITLDGLTGPGGFNNFDVRLDGSAVLDMVLSLGFADLSGDPVDALPTFLMDFFLEWEFVNANTAGGQPSTKPIVRFDNLRLDVGSFFADFLRPIIETIHAYLAPLKEVVDFLDEDMKFLSWSPIDKIFDANEDGRVTLLDLAQRFGVINDTAFEFINAVAKIFELVDVFSSTSLPTRGSGVTISLGSFDFGITDLRAESGDPFSSGTFSDAAQNVSDSFASLGGKAAEVFAATQPNNSSGEGKFVFELFDPQNLIRLIMGQPVNFFSYTLPEIDLDFGFNISIPVWSPPSVSVSFGAAIGFRASLTFGYDSSGITAFLEEDGVPGDLFGGFYIRVGDEVPPQLSLYGLITGGVSVGVGVIRASVTVGAGLVANFSLIDPGEGKLYLWQMARAIEQRGLLPAIKCFFVTEGEIFGVAKLAIEVFALFGYVEVFSIDVGPITLHDFSSDEDECFDALIPDRLEEFDGGIPNNDTRSFAADIGVAPGIHLRGASVSSPGDIDFYRFELLEADQLDIILEGNKAFELTLFDSDGQPIAVQAPGNDRKKIRTGTLLAGVYYLQIEDPKGKVYAAYDLDIVPGKSSSTRVFYVNNLYAAPPEVHSFYAFAPGDDSYADAGSSPLRPAASLARIAELYTLGSNDLILFDTGVYTGGFDISSASSGITVAGAPTQRFENLPGSVTFGSLLNDFDAGPTVHVNSADDVTLANFRFQDSDHGLLVTDSSGFRGTGLAFTANNLGLELVNTSDSLIEASTISSAGTVHTGMKVTGGTALVVDGVEFSNLNKGLILTDTVSATVGNLLASGVDNPVQVVGGSGLTLTGLAFDGREIRITPSGVPEYLGDGVIGVSVNNHTDLTLNDAEVSFFETGLKLTNSTGAHVEQLVTFTSKTGIRGWGLTDSTIASSLLRGTDYALYIGQSGGGATASTNLTLTGTTLEGPFSQILEGPSPGEALVADLDGFDANGNNLNGLFTVVDSANVTWRNGTVSKGSLQFEASSNVSVLNNSIEISGGAENIGVLFTRVTTGSIDGNTISGSGIGINVVSSDSVEVMNNTINATTTAIQVLGGSTIQATDIEVHDNTLELGSTGVFIANTFVSDVVIRDNQISDFTQNGIHAIGYASILRNDVSGSNVGIRFEPGTPGMRENLVHNNHIGLTGKGFLGNDDHTADTYNLVYLNDVGIRAEGDQQVAFNKVFENTIGIEVLGTAVIHHNVIYRNVDVDLQIAGAANVDVWNNTIYSTGNYGIRIFGGASGTDIRNNIVWSTGGTVLSVQFPSGDNLTSDYNNYYASDGAVLFEWIKTFDDLLDWQIELGLDLNSIGTTRIDPNLDRPAFVDLANDDFRIVDLTSTTINSGDPSFTFTNEPGPNAGPNGLRINQGAYGDTALAALSPASYIRVLAPNYYLDYTRDRSRRVVWESFNVTGNVSLELHQVGVGKVADITVVDVANVPVQVFDQPDSHGSYFWSPQMSGISGDNAKRYTIRVTSAANAAIHDQNREAFSVPVASNQFYVNDDSTLGDSLTTTTGDNRFTGKLASTPKAILPAVLQNYALTANQTVFVDAGSYLHLRNIYINSTDEGGNNEAFVLTGPVGDGSEVLFTRADLRPGAVGILLDDASFVSIRYLTIEGGHIGVEARNGSTFLALDTVEIRDHAGPQVYIHDGADRASLQRIRVLDGGGDGVVVDALLQTLAESLIQGNVGVGVRLTATGNATVQANRIYNNSAGGLYAYNTVSSSQSVIGNANLALGVGNILRDNGGRQVEVRGNVLVVGNTVYQTPGGDKDGSGIGIYLWNETAKHNVVFGHGTGIYSQTGATIEGNRIYNNSQQGIRLIGTSTQTVTGNVIYSNPIGINLTRSTSGSLTSGAVIRNNLIYDSSTVAVTLTRGSGYILESNTVYASEGDGLLVLQSTSGTVRNNIFHMEAGIAIGLDLNSQTNFDSDYNLFDISGSGSVGTWVGGNRATLQDWRNAAFLDKSSLATDPLFVDPDGADGLLGYDSIAVDGRDDNFHLQSIAGSVRNGSLVPVMDAGTGLPARLTPNIVIDASQSPGIDRGDDALAFGQEPSPNGNFINMGAFGNTSLASLSPVTYVLVMIPGGGETWPIGQSFEISWRSHDFTGTVDILLRQDGINDPLTTIAAATENDGSFVWTLTEALTPDEGYRIEVVRSGTAISGESLLPFSISEAIQFYYVNDAIVDAGGYTTAPGDNANDGLSPATPKASIRAILEAYDLGAGDVVMVDAGTYILTTNIIIEAEDSEATIRGFHDPARPELVTLINRNNRASGAYAFELVGTTGLTFERLTIANAYRGIHGGDASAISLTVRESVFSLNDDAGIYIDRNNPGLLVEGSTFTSSGTSGTGQGRQNYGINYGATHAVIRGNTFVDSYTGGLYLNSPSPNVEMEYLVEGNTASGSQYGIWTNGWVKNALIRNNTVSDNTQRGINASGTGTVVSGNTAFDNNVGIEVTNGATASGNVDVYNNTIGILAGSNATVTGNTVHDNTEGIRAGATGTGPFTLIENNEATANTIGIRFYYRTNIVGNVVYGNEQGLFSDGFLGSNSQWRGAAYNNMVYGNTEYALKILRSVGNPQVYNNTFVQSGESSVAVILDTAANVSLRNNIVAADAGLAMSISANSQDGFDADYNLYWLTGGAGGFLWGSTSFDSQADWFYNVGADKHAVFANPLFVDAAGGNYHLQAVSPAVDAGDPASPYGLEPEPSGNRINMGAYGNTLEAASSGESGIYVIDPTGLDKLLQNNSTEIDFLVSGFSDRQIVGQYTMTPAALEGWAPIPDRQGGINLSTTAAIDLSGVENPAPYAIYQQYLRSDAGAGQRIDFGLDLAPGQYVLRLHFMQEYSSDYAFDIVVDGVVVRDNYSILSESGGLRKALVEEIPVTVTEEGGLSLSLVVDNGYAFISGIQALRLYEGGEVDPRFTVELSRDNGATYATLATGVPVDQRGAGTFAWTPLLPTLGRTALIRVTSETPAPVSGTSNAFLIANDGNLYYVNDDSPDHDVYTSAVGDNLNTGKDPGSPMPSLEALLTVYSPSSGDIIFIDSGTYYLTRNIVLTAAESGITIIGAHDANDAEAVSILDRGNRASPNYGFELLGVNDLTLEWLTIANAYRGISAVDGGAVNLTVRNSHFIMNDDAGIYVERNNPGLLLENSLFEGSGLYQTGTGRQNYGLNFQGTHAVVRGNTFIDSYTAGLYLNSPSPNLEMEYLVEDNTVSGSQYSQYGIRTNGWVKNALIRNNTVSDTTQRGIDASGTGTMVIGNTAFDNNVGIEVTNGATATGNVEVYNNTIGILAGNNATVIGNTVHDNTEGIRAGASGSGTFTLIENNVATTNTIGIRFYFRSNIVGNLVYGNEQGLFSDGFLGSNSQWRGAAYNNLVYGNTEYALKVERAVGNPQVYNNTFVQAGASGTAILLVNAPNLDFFNNIVVVDAGLGLSVSADSQDGFFADYNLYSRTNGASGFKWGETFFNSHADWFYNTGNDKHGIFANPLFVNPGTGNYHLQPASPGVDGGNPAQAFGMEPEPSGGRINLGAYGNTAEATVSTARSITVLNPTSLDKFSQDRPATLDFLTTGFLDYQNVGSYYAGSVELEGWMPFASTSGGVLISNSTAVDQSGLAEAVPEGVFGQYLRSDSGAGKRIDVTFSASAGDYLLRILFTQDSTSSHNFNIEVNGVVVRESYSILTEAGGRDRAVAEDIPVTLSESGQVTLSLVVNTGFAYLSGLEVLRTYANGSPDPRFKVEVSYNSGATWSTLAKSAAVNSYGLGSVDWIPTTATDGRDALIRVVSNSFLQFGAVSDGFLVSNNGNRFYINDGSLDDNVYTSAFGNNNNSGKSPDKPMASLEALLNVYSPDPGDIIFIDTGTYLMTLNVLLTASESGITIRGAEDANNPDAVTILDRNNRLTPYYAFDLKGVTDLTLEHLTITGAYRGIQVDDRIGTADVTLRDLTIAFNRDVGLEIGIGNGFFTIEDSRFEGVGTYNQPGSQDEGIHTGSPTMLIRNTVFVGNYQYGLNAESGLSTITPDLRVEDSRFEGSYTGMRSNANFTTVLRSTFANNATDGLWITGTGSSVRDSVAYGNGFTSSNDGFYLQSGALAEGNLAYGNWRGFYGYNQSVLRNNVSFSNDRGLFVWDATAEGNRVYGNSLYGIGGYIAAVITGNQVYNNDVGIQGFRYSSTSFRGEISNNLVYNNGVAGIKVDYGATTLRVVNNTVYHPTGDALNIRNVTAARILNNILWVDAGFAINTDSASLNASVVIDYNLFFLSEDPNARIGEISEAFANTLADWQAQSGKDANGLFGDPLFFDRDGADDVGGYRDVSGILVDGGEDDNFHILKFSPAIDRGASWWITGSDLEGDARRDDPGTDDAGGDRYLATDLGTSLFNVSRGVGQGWNSSNSRYTLVLPFAFSFFGESYSQLQVSTSGQIGFPTLNTSSLTNTENGLITRVSLAPMWGNLDTSTGAGRDIFVDTSIPGEVYIRFEARNRSDSSIVQFAVLLKQDGSIRFDYGNGNVGLAPTVGLSAGNGIDFEFIEGYHGANDLSNASSVEINLVPGLTDIGAFEFKGNSLDNLPPVTVATLPEEIEIEGDFFGFLEQIEVRLSESIDTIDFRSPATYELIRDTSGDGQFSDIDTFYDLIPVIEAGSNTVKLVIDGGALVDGDYRFRIKAGNLRDVSGNLLDGDGSGTAGGDYIRAFNVVQPVLPEFTSGTETVAIRGESFTFQVGATNGPITYSASVLPAGLELDQNSGLISGIASEPGEFTVTLTATNADGFVEAPLRILVLAAPQVSLVLINDGDAQRSVVNRIEVFFDQDVSSTLAVTDFHILEETTGSQLESDRIQLVWSFITMSATLTFPLEVGGSLPNGSYTLSIEPADIVLNGLLLDGDGDGIQGGTYSNQFFRLLGDASADGAVDTLDGYRFRKAFGTALGNPGFLAEFDFNNDGLINASDRTAFESVFRSVLPGANTSQSVETVPVAVYAFVAPIDSAFTSMLDHQNDALRPASRSSILPQIQLSIQPDTYSNEATAPTLISLYPDTDLNLLER